MLLLGRILCSALEKDFRFCRDNQVYRSRGRGGVRSASQQSSKQLIQKVEFLRPSHEEVCCSMGGLLTVRPF